MAAPSRLSLRETIKSDAVLLFKALINTLPFFLDF